MLGRPVQTEPAVAAWTRPGLIALLVFVLCLGGYLSNGRTVPLLVGGDSIPNRLIPFSILGFGTLTLDPFREDFAAAVGPRWYAPERGGHLVSFYPVGTPLMALPVYIPFYVYLRATGRADHASLFQYSEQAEKLAASAIAAICVALFYLTVRRRLSPHSALWVSLAFGLGTGVWATASQMLWQHGAVSLAITSALLFLTWRGHPYWSAAGTGFALGLGVITRPTVLVFYLAGLGCQVLMAGPFRTRLLRVGLFIAAGAPLVIVDTSFGGSFYNSSLGGYTGLLFGKFVPTNVLLGLAGVLVSPNRGLFIFTPIALLGFYGLVRGSALSLREGEPLLPLFGLAVVVHLFTVASYREWAAGWSFGPRYMVDILPVLGFAAAGSWSSLSTLAKRLTAGALVWSVLVQFNGAFCYPASHWNGRAGPDIERQAWSLRHFELSEDLSAWRELGRLAAPY